MLASSANAWRCSLLRLGPGGGTAIRPTVSESFSGDGRSANTELKNRKERAVCVQNTWRGCERENSGQLPAVSGPLRVCASAEAVPRGRSIAAAYGSSTKSTHRRGAIARRQKWSGGQVEAYFAARTDWHWSGESDHRAGGKRGGTLTGERETLDFAAESPLHHRVDDRRAEALALRRSHGRSAALGPTHREGIAVNPPTHLDTTGTCRQCTVFAGVGRKLMECETKAWAAAAFKCSFGPCTAIRDPKKSARCAS
jgi:hypothetical protein